MKLRESASGRIRCGELGEDSLLGKLLPGLRVGKNVLAGAGDDAAVVAVPGAKNLVVLKTDCVVECIHFHSDASPEAIGWKAMMRPLSDFAAVSGLPEFALITLIIGKERRVEWVERIYRGLKRAARRFKVSIVGGETSGTVGPAIISVSVAGRVERSRWVSRSGGRIGDLLFVTGRLGGAVRGKHLRFVPRIEESRWLTANFRVHAMMDLSDGLGADLPRLARASKLSFQIDEDALPVARSVTTEQAISDGEDYELLFAISPRDCHRLQTRWRKYFPKLSLTQIGLLNPRSSIRNPQLKRGYLHFQ
jgi:thiamine-monophosphate kinase